VAVGFAIFFSGRKRPEYLYGKKDCIMTQPEKVCFEALQSTVGDKFYIFPQIHLASILDHKVRGQNWRGAFRHIDEKSVDFVLCDKVKLSPVLSIELDDRSHERLDRQDRDREVERILAEAKLPLLRLKHDFAKENLASMVDGAITH
jgi:very-short-patch-repair endonuclease